MIEVHPPEIGSFGDKVSELLEILGDSSYELLQVHGHRSKTISGLVPVKALSNSENTDLICVPAEDRETLSLLEDFPAPR